MTNKLKKLVQNGTEYEIPSYESKSAASGGTDLSLVTTGEKYTWNNKLENGSSSTGALQIYGWAGVQGTSVGNTSLATNGTTAVGFYARSEANHTVVIGHGATINSSGKRGIAIGAGATVKSAGSIQLGRGENTEAGSFSVALSTTPDTTSSYVNYKLLDVNGKIPNERLSLTAGKNVSISNNAINSDSISIVTQTDYDNLPSSKTSDDKTYFICETIS